MSKKADDLDRAVLELIAQQAALRMRVHLLESVVLGLLSELQSRSPDDASGISHEVRQRYEAVVGLRTEPWVIQSQTAMLELLNKVLAVTGEQPQRPGTQ